MLWFNFILGLNFIFHCFKLIITHYQTQKQREIKFKPRTKLNHNIYKDVLLKVNCVAGSYVDVPAITFPGLMREYCKIALTLEFVDETL